jgi:ABC-type Fe3+-siderophore transport system permease subunit
MIKSDFQTSWEEIKQKSYHLHWFFSLITYALLLLLVYKTSNNWQLSHIIFLSFVLNAMLWAVKEMVWFTAYTFEKRFAFLTWLKRFKVFSWSTPDWKDWRFSIYGSLPFTILIYFYLNGKINK